MELKINLKLFKMKNILAVLLILFTVPSIKAQDPFQHFNVTGTPNNYSTNSKMYFYVLDTIWNEFDDNYHYYFKLYHQDNIKLKYNQVWHLQDSLSARLKKTDIYYWAKQPAKPPYTKSEIGLGNVDNVADADKPISSATLIALNNKVDKISGKQLSQEDYSSSDKSKLSGISANATVNQTDAYLLSRSNHTGTQSVTTITGLSAVATSNSYNDLSGKLTAGTGISIGSGVVSNTLPDQIVNLTSGNRISITGTYPNFTINYIEPSISIVSRSVNTNFTISSTKQANVFYSITSSATNPLLAGASSGNAYLEYSTNSGTTWITVSQTGNSNGVGVAVAVALTNGQTSVLSGVIPANALTRIRTVVTGTATTTYVTGQEVY